MLCGFISGAGAATADGTYGMLAAFGVVSVARLLDEYQFFLHLLGGLFLLYLGYRIYHSSPNVNAVKDNAQGLVSAYATTFVLTLTNPMTIMSFAAIFAGIGIGADAGNYIRMSILVAGVFTGSLLWWLVLSSLISLLRIQFSAQGMRWINKLSGLMIIGFGLVSVFFNP
jgi:threonine/homoserine/homoserine lactone efflux protein